MPLGVESHRTHPIFMTLAWHYQLGLINCPDLPHWIITTCAYYWFFRMEHNTTYSHCVSFLSFTQNSLLIIKRLSSSWTCRFILRKGSKFYSFQFILSFRLHTWKLFFRSCLNLKFIPFNLDEHLFFHCKIVFLFEFFKFFLVLWLQSMETFDILV